MLFMKYKISKKKKQKLDVLHLRQHLIDLRKQDITTGRALAYEAKLMNSNVVAV